MIGFNPVEIGNGVTAGFTTRRGGVSFAAGDLNLALVPGEERRHLEENWRRVLARVGAKRLALCSQVHGAKVLRIGEESLAPMGTQPVGEADGLFTTEPAIALGIRVADCVPILLSAPGGVAVAHAGWRGVVKGVAVVAADSLRQALDCDLNDVHLAIGPHICGEHFEVGEEVVRALDEAGMPRKVTVVGESVRHRPLVSLTGALQHQLKEHGYVQVQASKRCTICHPDLFSYRSQGPQTGRFAGVVVWGG